MKDGGRSISCRGTTRTLPPLRRAPTASSSSAVRLCLCALVALSLLCLSAAAADVAHCTDPREIYYWEDGRDYSGVVNVTEGGIPCQKWTAQSPNAHDTDATSGTGGVGDHNYCRNPNGLARPWCITTDPLIKYQFCNVGHVCPWTPDTPTASASPISGTHFSRAQDAVVALSCFPRPCMLFYTLDGTQPSPASSILYRNEPFLLQHNTTVQFVALFANGNMHYRVARYTVAQPPPVTNTVYFTPPDAIAYTGPVLVALEGVKDGDAVLYYVNDTFKGRYKEPFWLNSSAEVVAVVNGNPIHAHYKTTVVSPTLTLIPPSGSFIGGTAVLVYPTSTEPATFFRRITTSATGGEAPRWVVMSANEMRFLVTETGVTRVSVKAVYLGGVESYAEATYIIAPATDPVFSPSPLLMYTRPVQVVCRDPTGRLLPLTGAGGVTRPSGSGSSSTDADASDEDPSEQEVLSSRLSSPGEYAVSCTYVDDARVRHSGNATFTLRAQPLPAPLHRPACEDAFPRTPLSLSGRLVPPSDNDEVYNGSVARLTLRVSAAEPASAFVHVDALTRTGADTFSYRVSPLPPPHDGMAMSSVFEVQLTATSPDPMEADSQGLPCRYSYLPLGTGATATVAARPLPTAAADCRTGRDGELGRGCAPVIADQLARCLHFNTTALIESDSIGPFLLLSVTGLDASLTALYEEKVMACLQNPSLVSVRDPVSASSGNVAVATGWRVVASVTGPLPVPGAVSTTLPAGTDFLVEVGGFHVDRTADYRFVREAYSCEDIGYHALSQAATPLTSPARTVLATPPTTAAVQTGQLRGSERSDPVASLSEVEDRRSAGEDTLALPFRIDTPGRYKLCARIGGSLYVVPSRYVHMTPILTTTPTAWPTIGTAVTADSCGGLVDVAHAETPLAVTFHAEPAWMFPSLSYSLDAGVWHTGKPHVAIALPKLVNTYTNIAEVVSASLGGTVGAPATVCVYFAPVLHPPVNSSGLTYTFHKAANRTVITLESNRTSHGSEGSQNSASASSGDDEMGRAGESGASGSAAGAEETNATVVVRKVVRGDADVVVTVHGTFQREERVVLHFYEEVADAEGGGSSGSHNSTARLALVASVLATPTPRGSAYPLAVPDTVLALPLGPGISPVHIRAVLDGAAAAAVVAPQQVALSPLSLAMFACATCKSGFCYSDYACVCVGAVNRTAYLCSEVPTPVEPETPLTSISERLLLLGVYFALLGAIGASFLVAIRRGAARSRQYAEAQAQDGATPMAGRPQRARGGRAVDVTIEGDEESVRVP